MVLFTLMMVGIGFLMGTMYVIEKVSEIDETVSKKLGNNFKIWWNNVFTIRTNEQKILDIEEEITELQTELEGLKELEPNEN